MPELASPRIVLSSPFRRARADASSRFHNFNSHRNRHPLETRRGGKEGKRGESRGKHGAEGGRRGRGRRGLGKIRWNANEKKMNSWRGGAWWRRRWRNSRWWYARERVCSIGNELGDSNDTRCNVREVGSRGHASLSVSGKALEGEMDEMEREGERRGGHGGVKRLPACGVDG